MFSSLPFGQIILDLQNFSNPFFDSLIGKSEELLPNFAILLSFGLGRQDEDECAMGTHTCQSSCVDGWYVA
jgi:hypothetical protein